MDSLTRRVVDHLTEQDRDLRLPWHDDPVGFARECVDWPPGTSLTRHQSEVLQGVVDNGRLALRSCHGVGKTTTASLLVLWHAVTRDAARIDFKCVSTAGSWRQLEHFLWPELHLWARRLRWDRIGREPFSERTELLTLNLTLRHGSAFAVASTDPQLIEGAHAESLLYIFDESKSISGDVFDAAEGAFAGTGEAFALAMSTPGEPSGRFYEFFARKPGLEDWQPRHVTLAEGVASGHVSQQWADQRARQWGEQSSLFRNRVLGEFAASDQDGVIPLPWVEQANDRWRLWQDAGADFGPVTHLGVDIGRGHDKSVLCLKSGDVISELRSYGVADTMQTTGYVAAVLHANLQCRAIVDVIGIGAGVVDRLREQGFKPQAFNASSGTDRKDRSGEIAFTNLRAAGWWHLRESLDPAYGATLALPEDDQLTADLIAPHYSVGSSGKLLIESKDQIRARLGRSTDFGDAVVMACFDAARGVGRGWMEYFQQQTVRDAEKPPERPAVAPIALFLAGQGVPVHEVNTCVGGHRFGFGGEQACRVCGKTPEELQ